MNKLKPDRETNASPDIDFMQIDAGTNWARS